MVDAWRGRRDKAADSIHVRSADKRAHRVDGREHAAHVLLGGGTILVLLLQGVEVLAVKRRAWNVDAKVTPTPPPCACCVENH